MKRTGFQTYLVKETICNSFLHTLRLTAISVTCKEMQVTPSALRRLGTCAPPSFHRTASITPRCLAPQMCRLQTAAAEARDEQGYKVLAVAA